MGIFTSIWIQGLLPGTLAGALGIGELAYWLSPKSLPLRSAKLWLAARFLLDAPVAYFGYVVLLTVTPTLAIVAAMTAATLGGPSLLRSQLAVLGKGRESQKRGRVGPEALHAWLRSTVDRKIDLHASVLERRAREDFLMTEPVQSWSDAELAEECTRHLDDRVQDDPTKLATLKRQIGAVLKNAPKSSRKLQIVTLMSRAGHTDYLKALQKEVSHRTPIVHDGQTEP